MIDAAQPRENKLRARLYAARFLSLLPPIQEQARCAFGDERPERRDELLAEVTANCWVGKTPSETEVGATCARCATGPSLFSGGIQGADPNLR
jgi:hypothetical protein